MRYALVTGGSKGIGRAICIELAKMGFYMLINYNSSQNDAEDTLSQVRNTGSDGELLKFDVANESEVKEVLENWQQTHKGETIEILVNNAGIRKDNLMIWLENKEWHDVLDISLNGFFYVTRQVLKNMLVKRKGRIINIVSLSGLKGLPGQVNYSAAKGAVISATKALSQEVAARKITVNAVAPGFIKTNMTEGLNEDELKKLVPAGRFGTPEEVASLVGFLASDSASYITGQVISINGGLYS